VFAIYAAVSVVPVLLIGAVLAVTFKGEANRRGLAEGRAEAILVAQTAVEPQLDGRALAVGLSSTENRQLRRLVSLAVGEQHVLRLRLRDLSGRVVFSDDGSGLGGKPDDEALTAARGRAVARLTHLNTDSDDTGSTGVSSVEVYLPLAAGFPAHRVGVLELYLPYAPIARNVTAGLHHLYLDLGIGLAVLYLVLFAITASATRGLRHELARNSFLAQHDTLTGLPNRTVFHHRARRALAAADRERPVVLAIIDVDRFKEINDTLGHHNGDRLLKELGARLAASTRPGDTVARLGGDEFGLIVSDLSDPQQALQELRSVIDREVELSGLPLSVEASVGFVVAPEDGVNVGSLLRRADLAMYGAKAHRVGVMRWEPSLDHYDAASLSLVSELRHAIDDGQLVLHYQPQVSLARSEVNAIEALVRWCHPAHGLLQPGQFLPLAEQTDVIEALTRWVLRTALSEVRALGPAYADLSVAVNVSARSIGRASFADEVIAVLRELEVPAERLIIEVTETALLADPPSAAVVLDRLSAAGVSISLDDFGRGQTSLAHLSALPIHELKIDKSFVGDMLDNGAHAAIVRSVIDLGHNLLLRVVAEGVERKEVLSSLRQSGCDIAQGFLLARPMPFTKLDGWLREAYAPAEPSFASTQSTT
jgi:diguanylate cyclase (GGDEF)-like protein